MSKFRRPTKEERQAFQESTGVIAPRKDNLVVEGYLCVVYQLRDKVLHRQ